MISDEQKKCLQDLPALSDLLAENACVVLSEKYGSGMVKLLLREKLEAMRARILDGCIRQRQDNAQILAEAAAAAERFCSANGLRAINAAGILLHTGLGRAPLSPAVVEKLRLFGGYTVLQTDIATGERSLREAKIEKMLCLLTGCEAATVVNNNAAATMLVLNTLCKGKEAIVSRGQLVEIGGAFRIPDVMEQSGAILREVGCTNQTHLRDYAHAVGENTGAFIHVHTSNYRIRGFSSMPGIADLCALRDKQFPDLAVVDDLGSGAPVPLSAFGLPDEPLISDSIKAGVDLCCFSGDKLLCGPQAGIICGKKTWIERIRKNPYARMFRTDKLCLAALEATLPEFINDTYRENLPLYKMLSRTQEELKICAENILENTADIFEILKLNAVIREDVSFIGSGAIPDEGIPTMVLSLEPDSDAETISLNALSKKLRMNLPPIFTRVNDNALILDMRTLFDDDIEPLICALRAWVN